MAEEETYLINYTLISIEFHTVMYGFLISAPKIEFLPFFIVF